MFALLIATVLLVACAVAVYQLSQGLNRQAALAVSVLLVGLIAGIPGVLLAPVLKEPSEPADLSRVSYKTSLSCRKCHAEQYESWHRTYHRTMTQDPFPENVLGDFNNVTVRIRGLDCRLARAGDRFFMDLVNPRWEAETLLADNKPSDTLHPPTVRYPIDRVVGSHVVQIYLTRFPNGEYRVLPLVWLVEENRWTSRSGHLLRPEAEHLYTDVSPWNTNCAFCHNTKVNPKITTDLSSLSGAGQGGNRFDTHFAEMGIACESCHGPGERHIAANRNPVRRYALSQSGRDDPTIVNPAKLSKELSQEVCSRCHGRWYVQEEHQSVVSVLGDLFVPGGERLARRHSHGFTFFDKAVDSVEPDENLFWPDWTPRPAAMENIGFVLSPCYQKGSLTCVSCHSMHKSDPNDQLLFPDTLDTSPEVTNRACTQCHAQYKKRDVLARHSNHPADSWGSVCYNCHMPYQSFGLLTAKRTHRIASPNVTVTANTGLPSACNQCHIDQPLQWTAEWMEKWYGQDVPALSNDQKTLSATLVDLLSGNAISRALAATMMGWDAAGEVAPGRWPVAFLAYTLDDTYPLVRLSAFRSIRKFPGFEDVEFDYLGDRDTRREQAEAVHRRWSRVAGTSSALPSGPIPLETNGQPIGEVVRRLLDHQDQTVIELSE